VKGLTLGQRESAYGLALVSPQIAGFLIFVAGPILFVAWIALHDWDIIRGTIEFAGTANFERIAGDTNFPTVAGASLMFAAGLVAFTVIIGLSLALAVNTATIGAGLFRTVYFVPVVISIVAWAIVWRLLLQDDGAVNGLLALLGLEGPNWLREAGSALAMIILVDGLKGVGLAMVIFLAALQGIPRDLEDAARADGAGRYAVFRNVTLPLITPFLFLVIILSLVSSVKSFALIFLLTRGGPGYSTTILANYIYEQGFQRFDMGYASALAVLLFVSVAAITAANFALRRRWVVYEE
jgi:multiple sugar transport system permease protein